MPTIGGTPPMSSITLLLCDALKVTSHPSDGRLSRMALTDSSTPALRTAPRFSNRVALAPTEGATVRAMRASLARLW